ncbi:hypothetical protein GCM10009765_82780 [Fodinicola feengrottensis]|uniref:Alpha-galactosidase n=1 Tax=Fodinicola feengrottensis TaxID=435914 RepID=A0ABN2JC15_9ACTN
MAAVRRILFRGMARAALGVALAAASLVAVTVTASPPAAAGINGLAQKPYMGWSSWSLESTNYPGLGNENWLTEQHIMQQTDVLAAKLKSHGYDYINVDAGWTDGTGDENGRPVALASRFPHGMKYVGDYVHSKGLKFGLYLAVGLDPKVYNDGNTPIYGAPQCHTKDVVYSDLRKTNGWDGAYKMDFGNPCSQLYLNSIADELASWGADFLKVDGVGPGSFKGGDNYDNTADVAAWGQALKQTGRPIELTLSWALAHPQAGVWKQYSNGWRIDTDVECYCNTLVTWNNSIKQRWNDVVQWIPDAGPGHWNNLDSLDVGNAEMDGITDAERQSYMTLWAISAAPLYSGDDLTKLDSYGLSLLTNDEVIAVDQAGNPAKPVNQNSNQQVWYAKDADGSYTVALFNLGTDPARVTANWNDLGIVGPGNVRDLWQHNNLGSANGSFSATLPAHGSRLLRIAPQAHINGPSMPVNVHGTSASSSTVSLAWDASAVHGGKVAWYDIYTGSKKAASVRGTAGTVSGLKPSTSYQFTVVARDSANRASASSKKITVTTPKTGGPTGYEAEAAGNTLGPGSDIANCGGCSGGKKAGNLGGSGFLRYNNVTVDKAGTYLMNVAYVDGDSSRLAIVTVNNTPFNLPLSGTNNNDWDNPQNTVVPVQLQAGVNTISFGNPNPGDYVSDIDKITL